MRKGKGRSSGRGRNSGKAKGQGRKQGKGRRGQGSKGASSGSDKCVCPNCGAEVMHERGVPCSEQRCPSCGSPLRNPDSGRSQQGVRQNFSSKNSKQEQPRTVSEETPRVDQEICIGCGVCEKECPSDAIVIEDGKAKIQSVLCSNCRACVSACPQGAIE